MYVNLSTISNSQFTVIVSIPELTNFVFGCPVLLWINVFRTHLFTDFAIIFCSFWLENSKAPSWLVSEWHNFDNCRVCALSCQSFCFVSSSMFALISSNRVSQRLFSIVVVWGFGNSNVLTEITFRSEGLPQALIRFDLVFSLVSSICITKLSNCLWSWVGVFRRELSCLKLYYGM